MTEWFLGLGPIAQAFLATCFTWFVTAVGAAAVFLFREIKPKVLDGMLGFSAGVMIAASVWSLLIPAIDLSAGGAVPIWFPAVVGFMLGGGFLRLIDLVLPHLHLGLPTRRQRAFQPSGDAASCWSWRSRCTTFPKDWPSVSPLAPSPGVAVSDPVAGMALAIGIGLQNFPEGAAVSIPLRREGLSRLKCFWYGQLSGIVEPMAALVGAAAVVLMRRSSPTRCPSPQAP